MASRRRPGGAAEIREEYMERQRWITALKVRLSDPPGTIYADAWPPHKVPDGGAAALAELARLEAGGDILVADWAPGSTTKLEFFDMHADGTCTRHIPPRDENGVEKARGSFTIADMEAQLRRP